MERRLPQQRRQAGAPVEEADAAVLSHDHYDHGQSFPLFFERMAGRKYLFYLSSDVLWPGYHRRRRAR